MLAKTGWLADRLSDRSIRIVDARSKPDYDTGHIHGAVNMDGFGSSIPRAENGDMRSAAEWARTVGGLGISNDSTVVVYDTPSQRMGMVAWTFLYYGHADVRILDGGVTKWLAEDRPLETRQPHWPALTYLAMPVEAVYCSLEQAKAGAERDDFVFWDTRPDAEYTGDEAGYRAPPRPGHIPGAGHLDWTELFEPESRALKPAAELRQLLEAQGITSDKQVASYCNGGRPRSAGWLRAASARLRSRPDVRGLLRAVVEPAGHCRGALGTRAGGGVARPPLPADRHVRSPDAMRVVNVERLKDLR
jgi:thiosulfate/3-mercaptopyruvate sulfurtransferase